MPISQLSQALGDVAPTEIRILPAGKFRAADGSGRPANVAAWMTDANIAKSIISASFAAYKELLIDYEHQSLATQKNGQLVPAAGWFRGLEWRAGMGLYATAVQWNKRAAEMIAAREYRFISPVFVYNQTSGAVERIVSVAITNTPALPDLFDLSTTTAAASTTFQRANSDSGQIALEDQRGYELLARMSGPDSAFAKRIALCSGNGEAVTWSPSAAADPRNQRGMELLQRMMES